MYGGNGHTEKVLNLFSIWSRYYFPMYMSLPRELREALVAIGEKVENFGQRKSDLLIDVPEGTKEVLAPFETRTLSIASHAVYGLGHFDDKRVNTPLRLDAICSSPTWKISSVLDQVIAGRLSVNPRMSPKSGYGFNGIHEGVMRVAYSSTNTWTWEEFGFACQETLDSIVKFLTVTFRSEAPFVGSPESFLETYAKKNGFIAGKVFEQHKEIVPAFYSSERLFNEAKGRKGNVDGFMPFVVASLIGLKVFKSTWYAKSIDDVKKAADINNRHGYGGVFVLLDNTTLTTAVSSTKVLEAVEIIRKEGQPIPSALEEIATAHTRWCEETAAAATARDVYKEGDN